MIKWSEKREQFIRKVNELLWYNDMTEDTVEKACRLSPGFFAEIRCEKCCFQPSAEELESIANYFGVELEDMFECEPESKVEREYLVRYKRYVSVINMKVGGKKVDIIV